MTRTVVVVGGLHSAALIAVAAGLNVSIVETNEPRYITGTDHKEERDLAALLAAVSPRIAEPKEPAPYYRESGKQKAQWKRERNGRRGA